MKKILLVIVIITIGLPAIAVKPLEHQFVLQCDSLDAKQLYMVVGRWFAENYNDSQKVIQLKDDNEKAIIGKASVWLGFSGIKWGCLSGPISYNIKVECRDKRVRVTMNMMSQQCDARCDPSWSIGPLYDVDIDNMDPFYKDLNINGLYKSKYKPFYKKALPFIKMEFASICESILTYIAKKELKTEDNW